MINKCDCYEEREVMESFPFDRRLIGICNGTKERDDCYCKGNKTKCDFYPEVKKESKTVKSGMQR